jgi:hypothetical protein
MPLRIRAMPAVSPLTRQAVLHAQLPEGDDRRSVNRQMAP